MSDFGNDFDGAGVFSDVSAEAIARVHWGFVERRRWRDQDGELFAIWPDPIDHDACFEAADFEGFADTGDGWDEDYQQLVERVVGTLARFGAPALVRDASPLSAAQY